MLETSRDLQRKGTDSVRLSGAAYSRYPAIANRLLSQTVCEKERREIAAYRVDIPLSIRCQKDLGS